MLTLEAFRQRAAVKTAAVCTHVATILAFLAERCVVLAGLKTGSDRRLVRLVNSIRVVAVAGPASALTFDTFRQRTATSGTGACGRAETVFAFPAEPIRPGRLVAVVGVETS